MSNLSLFHEKLICNKAQEFRTLFPDSDLILSLFNGQKWTRYEFISGNLKANIQESIFDLASLTKVFIATITLKLIKYQKLKLNSLVHSVVYTLHDFKHLELVKLLNHSSHLDLIQKFDTTKAYSKEEFENIIFSPNNLQYKRLLTKFLYCDLNYLYLGKILETISNTTLDELILEFNQEFGFNLNYNPLLKNIKDDLLVPTSKTIQAGNVNDFKSCTLGGITGHAGLFGTIDDLEKCANNWIYNNWHFSSELYNQAFDFDTTHPPDKEIFGLVWRLGGYCTLPNHSGFTGPTMVLNPAQEISLVHLNNYTYSKVDNGREKFKKWNHEVCSLIPV